MADSNESRNSDEKLELFCDPCHSEGENNAAISFCEVCNEYLCKHCNKSHRRLAATREHVVKERNDLPEKSPSESSAVGIPAKCFVHESESISHYCISHEEFCCSKCLPRRHPNCKDILKADECLSECAIKEEQDDLENNMREQIEDLNKTMHLIQQSHKAIENHYDSAHSSMLKVKTNVFNHIEDIFNKLVIQLRQTRDNDLDKISHYKEKCDAVSFDIKTLNTYLKEKKRGKRYQLISAVRNASIKIQSNGPELQKIKSSLSLNVKMYCFQPDSMITQLKSKPSSFGKIDVKPNANKSAHLVDTLNVQDQDELNTCCVTGLALLSETHLILTDCKNASVKLFETEQDKILSKVKLESAPWDVCALSRSQVAVTIPDSKTVDFLSVSENTSLKKLQSKQIKLEGKCYGLTYANNKIIVIVRVEEQPAKLEWYDLDGKLSLSIETKANNPLYIASNADGVKIYVSDNAQCMNIIERSSVDGNILNKLDNCRDEVTGMTMDKTGVLYYCDSYSHEIDYVYVDGEKGDKRERVNLVEKMSPHPNCIAFCNDTNRLFVGKEGNDIGIFIVI